MQVHISRPITAQIELFLFATSTFHRILCSQLGWPNCFEVGRSIQKQKFNTTQLSEERRSRDYTSLILCTFVVNIYSVFSFCFTYAQFLASISTTVSSIEFSQIYPLMSELTSTTSCPPLTLDVKKQNSIIIVYG